MATLMNTVRNSLIDEIVDAERYLNGQVDEARLRDEIGKFNLFALTETSAYAREAVQLRQQNELAVETRRMIEAQRRREADKTKDFLS